jgi:hypothetical protein
MIFPFLFLYSQSIVKKIYKIFIVSMQIIYEKDPDFSENNIILPRNKSFVYPDTVIQDLTRNNIDNGI